jgi:hypothetical protein
MPVWLSDRGRWAGTYRINGADESEDVWPPLFYFRDPKSAIFRTYYGRTTLMRYGINYV